MPEDPRQQLEQLRRSMCGDCGVGPFKAGGRGKRSPWWLAGLLIVAVALLILILFLIIR